MRARTLRIFPIAFAVLAATPAFATCDDPAWNTFEIGAGPFTPQLSDATAPSFAAAIIPAP